jgi:sugar lactone lactonase YvrE
LQGEIGAISPDGQRSTAAMLPPGANPITLSDDGRLFVGRCFLGDELYEVDLEGGEHRIVLEDVGGCGMNGMDFGPDGLLYGPWWFAGAVVSVDVDSGEVQTVAEDITVPAAVKFDSMGNLYVLDTAMGQVLRVDMETGDTELVAQLPIGLDNMAFNAEDRLFVSSFVDGSVFEVLDDGTTRTVLEGGLMASGGLALMGDTLYAADFLALKGYDTTSGEQVYLEPDIVGISPLGSMNTVSVDGDNLMITSWFTNAVRVWNPETNEVLEDYSDFAVPLNAIRFDGDIIVAELGSGQVVRANGDDPSDRSVLTDAVVVPAGLAGNDSNLYVSDWATGMIWQLVADGEPLAEARLVVEGLANPEGMELTADGSALVVVANGSDNLLEVDVESGEVTVLAENLGVGLPGPDGSPPTNIFSDVAIAEDGTIYVSADIADVFYVMSPLYPHT